MKIHSSKLPQSQEASSERSAKTRLEKKAAPQSLLHLSKIPYEYRKIVQGIKRMIHAELLKRVNLKNLTARAAEQDTIHRQARETIQSILKDYRTKLPKAVELAALEKELYDEAIGLGPIETLLDDADITEIMVNGATNIYIEKGAISILPILHSPIIIKS